MYVRTRLNLIGSYNSVGAENTNEILQFVRTIQFVRKIGKFLRSHNSICSNNRLRAEHEQKLFRSHCVRKTRTEIDHSNDRVRKIKR